MGLSLIDRRHIPPSTFMDAPSKHTTRMNHTTTCGIRTTTLGLELHQLGLKNQVKDMDADIITNPTIEFLLKQVYSVYKKEHKALETEIQNLKKQVQELKQENSKEVVCSKCRLRLSPDRENKLADSPSHGGSPKSPVRRTLTDSSNLLSLAKRRPPSETHSEGGTEQKPNVEQLARITQKEKVGLWLKHQSFEAEDNPERSPHRSSSLHADIEIIPLPSPDTSPGEDSETLLQNFYPDIKKKEFPIHFDVRNQLGDNAANTRPHTKVFGRKQNENEYNVTAKADQSRKMLNQNSFDLISDDDDDEPAYKFKRGAVRKKEHRNQLQGQTCKDCEKHYSYLPEKERNQALKHCSKHRDNYLAPSTPENYWDTKFPSTAECYDKGILNMPEKSDTRPSSRKRLALGR